MLTSKYISEEIKSLTLFCGVSGDLRLEQIVLKQAVLKQPKCRINPLPASHRSYRDSYF